MKCYGAIEAGGTKIVCGIGSGPEDLETVVFPTRTPDETIANIVCYFRERIVVRPISAVGVASFGPADIDPSSPTFGLITSTPKPGWRNTDLISPLVEFRVPIAFDTDVNAAALGEATWGAGSGVDDL